MKKILALSIVAVTIGCTAQAPVEPSAEAQTKLAAAIEGMVAAPPRNCIHLRDLRGNESAGEEAIIFRSTSNKLLHVNRPPGGCPSLDGRALKLRTTGTQVCRGDIVEVFDPVSGVSSGGCSLGDFTPYRRLR